MNVDILMGIASGTATCDVTYGNGSIAELKESRADYIVSDFASLINRKLISDSVIPKRQSYTCINII